MKPAGALLVLAQVVTAPAIGDCEMLDGLKLLADPTAIGKPVNDTPAHVTLTANQSGVIEGVFSAIGSASEMFDRSCIVAGPIRRPVAQPYELAAVRAESILLVE
jgi:hypothetical protein